RALYYDANTGRVVSEDPIGFNGGDSKLYRDVVNNPRNLTDPLGLLVNAVFNPSNGTLKIIDNDTGRTVIVENVFSGDNTHYPIPPGSYEILEHSHPHWFRLDPIDQYPR
ncbi:MAG: RHS repeat-associated core domain-containing protein, partial [Dolichospermum sp.]